jgi:hypothetical protein
MNAKHLPRYTTAEAAQVLNCANPAALLLLQGARVSYTRNTQHGSYFWNAAQVEQLASTLRYNTTASAETGGQPTEKK